MMKGRVRVADVTKPKDRDIAAKQGCFLIKEELVPNLKPWCKTEEAVINYMKKNEKVIKEAYERNKRMFTDKQKEWEHVRYASSVAECLEWMYE